MAIHNEVKNLSTKNIKDFNPDVDTIYIKDYKAFNQAAFLCKFKSFDAKKLRVTGEVIANNEDYQHEVGREVTAKLADCYLYGESESGGEKRSYCHWFDSLGFALNPIDAQKRIDDIHTPKHESFAVIRGSRRNSRGTSLFGSGIQHNQTITITICNATHTRSLNNDSIYGGKEIIEVELSENQFAQFITSMNNGGGIPCTIRHMNGKRMSDPPFLTKQEMFEGEFQNDMDNYTLDLEKTWNDVEAVLSKPSIGKGDKELIAKGVQKLISMINSNLPFVRKQFREQMDDVVNDAKVQIEAFAENVIRTKGLEALAKDNPDLKDIILEITGRKEKGE